MGKCYVTRHYQKLFVTDKPLKPSLGIVVGHRTKTTGEIFFQRLIINWQHTELLEIRWLLRRVFKSQIHADILELINEFKIYINLAIFRHIVLTLWEYKCFHLKFNFHYVNIHLLWCLKSLRSVPWDITLRFNKCVHTVCGGDFYFPYFLGFRYSKG